jgi:hypothetical protein
LQQAPRGGAHEDIAEKAAGNQADAADQTAEERAVDDAERGDHDGLGDRHHQISPEECDANRPCPVVVASQHEDRVVGILRRRDHRTCGQGQPQHADDDRA